MKYLIRFIFITVIGLSYAYSVNAQPSASHDLVLTVEAWSSIDLSNTQVDMSLNNDDVTSVTDNSTQLTWGTNSTSTQKIVVSSDIDPYVISVQATNFGPDGTGSGNPKSGNINTEYHQFCWCRGKAKSAQAG